MPPSNPSTPQTPSTPTKRPSTPVPSLTSYLSHLPGTVSGYLTRLSSTPTLPTLSPVSPPPRTHSPYHPPPLSPLALSPTPTPTTAPLLTAPLAEEIRLLLPPRLQLVNSWTLRYSLARDGVSLATLYARCADDRFRSGGWVLVVKDGTDAGVLGAYLSHPPMLSGKGERYYGTGECFLWRSTAISVGGMELPPPPSEDTTRLGRSTTISSATERPDIAGILEGGGGSSGRKEERRMRFKAFPYSGENEYLILCEAGFLSLGGGDEGRYGLWLDEVLERGVSSPCSTFGNEALSEQEDGGKFDVLGVEVWFVGSGS